jgi:hypothetical protein
VLEAICFSVHDAGASGAGKKPRQEVHCRDGHSDAEKHAGKHTLRATFTEGETATTIATKDSPRAIVLVKRLLLDAHGVFPRGLATHLRKCRLSKIRDGFLAEGFLHCRRVPFR